MNSAFTLLPMNQRFYLVPGSVYTGSITVVNPADATEDFMYQVTVSPYNVVGEDYSADLMMESNYSRLTEWIQIAEPTGSIKPNESKDIEFTISVPEDAEPGGQYAALLVSSDTSQQIDSSVSVESIFEMASVIYANVEGEVILDGEIVENIIPGFVTGAPITLEAILTNSGNVHMDATFIITATDMFSGQVILPTGELSGQYSELVMPETTRHVKREISNLPTVGVIKINQTIYYNGEVSVFEKNVIICPIWLIVLALLALVAVILAVTFWIKKMLGRKKLTDKVFML